jgi:hypothetical protein
LRCAITSRWLEEQMLGLLSGRIRIRGIRTPGCFERSWREEVCNRHLF